MEKTLVDVDDFWQGHDGFAFLFEKKSVSPDFLVTVFCPVNLSSLAWLKAVKVMLPWIDLAAHGLIHDTPRECENWTYETALMYLDHVEGMGVFTKLFKAPGWQISDGCYQALLEKGWAVADQAYNDDRRPPGLPYYLLDHPKKHHFHVQNVCGNGLEESKETLMAIPGPFGFVKDHLVRQPD